ncbi:MAG: VCBS repeat-containing protein [Minicystis sp.]
MTRSRGFLAAAGLLAGGFAASIALPASADWPMSRHDAQRTAAAKGKSNITNPVPTWRFPLGGALFQGQALVADSDGDQKPEFYFVRGSSAVGKRLDDSVILHSPSMGITGVQALADLDGDGKPELVVSVGTNQLAVIDGATGDVDWVLPATELGVASGTLVADLDGDGLPELLVQDCGCCAVMGSIPGAVYSFAGNAKAPKVLWQLPYAQCGGSSSTTIVDADGDGKNEVLMGRMDGFDLLDGKNGKPKASLTFGANLQLSACQAAKITGAPGEQVVCVYGNSTGDDSGHTVFALGYSASPPSLSVLWSRKVGAYDQILGVKPGMIADLDGDGLKEVTIAAQSSPTSWTTFVLDAATGAVLTTLDGHELAATAPILSGGRRLILTEEADGIAGWSFTRKPTPKATSLWQITGQNTLGFRDYALSAKSSVKNGLVTVDLTGDGTPDLITVDTVDGTVRVLDASSGAVAPPVVAGAGAPPMNEGLLWSAPTTVQGQPALVAGFSDGVFHLKGLKNGAIVDIVPPTTHFDGFYSTSFWRSQGGAPVVAKLRDGQTDSVLVTNAAGTLHVLDATKADAMTPPVERWSRPRTTAPMVLPNLKGSSAGVVLVEQQPIASNPPKQQVSALDADGAPFWVSPIDGGSWSDLVAGNLDGDGKGDVILSWGTGADGFTTVRTRAISGASGATLWEAPKPLPIFEFTGATLHDWDGDGRDDVFVEVKGLHVLSGQNGAEISPAPVESTQNGMPLIADLNQDGAPEVVLQGGYSKVTVLSSNLAQVLYQSQDTQGTIQYGALARCPGGDKLVEGTYFYHTARLTITELDLSVVGKAATMFLAGGQKFADEGAATAAGVYQGVLTAVSVHEDSHGARPPDRGRGLDGRLALRRRSVQRQPRLRLRLQGRRGLGRLRRHRRGRARRDHRRGGRRLSLRSQAEARRAGHRRHRRHRRHGWHRRHGGHRRRGHGRQAGRRVHHQRPRNLLLRDARRARRLGARPVGLRGAGRGGDGAAAIEAGVRSRRPR